MKENFLLRPDITFFNFGSFGACPKPIFEKYQQLQVEMEAEPVQFIVYNGPKLLAESRKRLSEFIACDQNDLLYIPNPTYGVNLVANSLDLQEGDEVLSANIEYGACDKTWKFFCQEKGANYVMQPITLPLTSKEKFLEDFWKGATEKTKMIFISHITSATGLILPVAEIVQEAKRRGILSFVDGAHAPAHIDLKIDELGADFYTGACHKWMMTPKGSSFLHVKKEHQNNLKPILVSWGYNNDDPTSVSFQEINQFTGTRDYTAYLCIPEAIDFMKVNDWWGWAEESRMLVQKWLPKLCDLVGSKPLAPVTDEFIGQLGSIPINCSKPLELKEVLYREFQIEIPVMEQGGNVYLRYSLNAFNTEQDLERLEEVIVVLMERGLIEKY